MKALMSALLCCCCGCGLAQWPRLLISEVLFNPVRDGFDYVELYNDSELDIALDDFMIGNRNSTGDVASLKPLARGPTVLHGKQFCVISANTKWVGQHYALGRDALLCELAAMPSYPDEEGNVVVLQRTDSVIVDELRYRNDWHLEVLGDDEGVSLERISYSALTQDRNNWTSAASSAGYGTPGSVNSQHLEPPSVAAGGIVLSTPVFSPDNDGVSDYLLIRYTMQETGAVANAKVYDLNGRPVSYFLRNEVLGTSGQFRWDGLDDHGRIAANGMYLLVIQIFGQRGRTWKYKKAVTIAGKR